MNRSFHEGIFPYIWKLSNVIPIFKKGDKSEPSNYRPVALLSCIGKLQERIVFKNMYNFLIDNNLLYKYQSDFLPHHSTVFQLIDIFHNICQAFDNNMFSWLSSVMCQKHLIEFGTKARRLRAKIVQFRIQAWNLSHLLRLVSWWFLDIEPLRQISSAHAQG